MAFPWPTPWRKSMSGWPPASRSNSRLPSHRPACSCAMRVWAGWPDGCGQPGIADDELLRQARQDHATVLTTDGMLMERRLLRDRVIPAFWLPPTLKIPEQMALVFREFGLMLREPRCMSCGGELRRGSKEDLRERIQ